MGAGTSMALGLPGIWELTKEIEDNISVDLVNEYKNIKESLKAHIDEDEITIEDILNQVRLIRKLTRESVDKEYSGVTGKSARLLDIEICNQIFNYISEKEEKAELETPRKFLSWLNWLHRDYTKEIFTTNYDLIIEKSLEKIRIPYFDGFVGAYEPFFLPESLEENNLSESVPISWIRLWKIHGSFGWFWKKEVEYDRAVRLGSIDKCDLKNKELIIYPSREKYESSRKQPFISYFDRMKNYLNKGEKLFIVAGYSFSDEHINEVIYNSLKYNNHLHIIVFIFSDSDFSKIENHIVEFMNLTVFSPSKASIGGIVKKIKLPEGEKISPKVYDDSLLLGDFNKLVDFLIETSGNGKLICGDLK